MNAVGRDNGFTAIGALRGMSIGSSLKDPIDGRTKKRPLQDGKAILARRFSLAQRFGWMQAQIPPRKRRGGISKLFDG
jgi:hypothetical protein